MIAAFASCSRAIKWQWTYRHVLSLFLPRIRHLPYGHRHSFHVLVGCNATGELATSTDSSTEVDVAAADTATAIDLVAILSTFAWLVTILIWIFHV